MAIIATYKDGRQKTVYDEDDSDLFYELLPFQIALSVDIVKTDELPVGYFDNSRQGLKLRRQSRLTIDQKTRLYDDYDKDGKYGAVLTLTRNDETVIDKNNLSDVIRDLRQFDICSDMTDVLTDVDKDLDVVNVIIKK